MYSTNQIKIVLLLLYNKSTKNIVQDKGGRDMVLLGQIADIKSGINTIRLNGKEWLDLYSVNHFLSDFNKMYLAQRDNDIIYYQISKGDNGSFATVISDRNQDKKINQSFALIKPNLSLVDPFYLCYALNESQDIKRQRSYSTQGSLVTRISPKTLKSFQITLPPMDTQVRLGKAYALAIYNHYLQKQLMQQELQGALALVRKIDNQQKEKKN